jgi:GalNAc-alpha-(1->4)-GalNAc-alpha-(1->3)-diNAcBac-PP-undecaprenol alpha-1,4-N-acetyl-D-galactosaminyltransferase
MRVTLVIGSLVLGGAERQITLMADYWAVKGWHVTLITFIEGDNHYSVHPEVRQISAYVPASSTRLLARMNEAIRRQFALRRAICDSQPNVVISFLNKTNVRVLMATIGLKVPCIVCERSVPHLDELSFFWGLLRRFLYPHAASVVAQTKGALEYFPPRIHERGRVIPNPVVCPGSGSPQNKLSRSPGKVVVSLGRLADEKGFDLLINAFAIIVDRHPDWSLYIWGEGGNRSSLEGLAKELGIDSRVHLSGSTKEPTGRLREADLFVLSSHYEGFPNALCEAMACGLPVISFNCPYGPMEIIRDGVDGLLVPNEDVRALAAAMDRLMADETERNHFAAAAPNILERFSVYKVMNMWENVISHVTSRTD